MKTYTIVWTWIGSAEFISPPKGVYFMKKQFVFTGSTILQKQAVSHATQHRGFRDSLCLSKLFIEKGKKGVTKDA